MILVHDYLEISEGIRRLANNYLDEPGGSMGMANDTMEVTHMVLLVTCRLVLTIQMHLLGIYHVYRLILAIHVCH